MKMKTPTEYFIEESMRLNKIVTIAWSQELEDDLLLLSADYVRNGNIIEFWGHDWRIHLEKGRGDEEVEK